MNNPSVVVDNVWKSYSSPTGGKVEVLAGLTLAVARGDRVAIQGVSGSGKSTLLNVIGGLAKPDSGDIMIAGLSIVQMSNTEMAHFRRTHIGLVFQRSNLLAGLSVIENALLPLRLSGLSGYTAIARAEQVLRQVGLAQRMNHRVPELSEGEKQRAAIARAIVTSPTILLADEPTGSLDPANKQAVLDIFERLGGTAVILVTHDAEVAARCHHRYKLASKMLTEL